LEVLNARVEGVIKLDSRIGDSDHLGLAGQSVGTNYYDILPFGNYDAYSGAWFCRSLAAMAEIERAVGCLDNAREYERLFTVAQKKYNELYWTDQGHMDGLGRYIACIDINGKTRD
jgi:hypothetical protein